MWVLIVVALTVFTGCGPKAVEVEPLLEGKELLTVDFQQDRTLRYKFVSSRDIELDWEPAKTEKVSKSRKRSASKSRKSSIAKSSETLEMVVSYTPLEVNPYGLTTVKATCESVTVKRSKATHKDAVETLPRKSFTFTIGPTGRVEDYSQLEKLIERIGQKAFRPNTKRGKIKEPDMVSDFAACQWFLWDSISSIEKATAGVSPGQTWQSKLSVTGPMVIRKARNVTYELAEIRQSERGRLAVIKSCYSPTDAVPEDRWPPLPYYGRFQMSVTFGFLRGYKILELSGTGEEIFNIDTGRLEKANQQYEVLMEASIPMGIEAHPHVTIKQNFKTQLLK